jgi:hypothetical protein
MGRRGGTTWADEVLGGGGGGLHDSLATQSAGNGPRPAGEGRAACTRPCVTWSERAMAADRQALATARAGREPAVDAWALARLTGGGVNPV